MQKIQHNHNCSNPKRIRTQKWYAIFSHIIIDSLHYLAISGPLAHPFAAMPVSVRMFFTKSTSAISYFFLCRLLRSILNDRHAAAPTVFDLLLPLSTAIANSVGWLASHIGMSQQYKCFVVSGGCYCNCSPIQPIGQNIAFNCS